MCEYRLEARVWDLLFTCTRPKKLTKKWHTTISYTETESMLFKDSVSIVRGGPFYVEIFPREMNAGKLFSGES